MKYINIKKIKALFLTGIILVTMTGCQMIEKESAQPKDNQTVESTMEEDNVKEDVIIEDNNIKEEEIKTEDDLVTYFNNFEEEIDTKINEGKLEEFKESAKNAAITGIDFVFYGKEINGYTFDELSDEAKAKVLLLVNNIDAKLESNLPGYKETVKDKYGKAYDVVTEKLDEAAKTLDGYLDNKYGEDYTEFKDKTSDLWDDFKDSAKSGYESTKEVAGEGWSKIKGWYENKTGK